MERVVIGICAALEQARWTVWDQLAVMTPWNYVEAVHRAGGAVLLLPPDPLVAAQPDGTLDLLDGLMLAGGSDIDPDLYGQPRHPLTVGTMPERDRFEIALARRALERDLPILGICRGMQVLNVARGGTLIQDLPERFGHSDHRRVSGSFEGSDHLVGLAPDSLVARAAGERTHSTKSHHHQGVGRVGDGWVISGWAAPDDLPEAIEDPTRSFALGVQWHPEADEESQLVAALVGAARVHRAERAAAAG
ncbi:MAG: gamma-glutamyl-gamma-aminobutyrate hydrolase family protein [Solirubrobacteraceae bacterium]